VFTHLTGWHCKLRPNTEGGYNRNLTLTNNEFAYIGDSAMAAWGDTSAALNANGTATVPGGHKVGPDGRSGEQPRGTVVRGNIAHDIGLWQKQSSMWFQAVCAARFRAEKLVLLEERYWDARLLLWLK
jgi:hypothetical protein